MINFINNAYIFNNIQTQNLYGGYQRIEDLFRYMKKHNMNYSLNNFLNLKNTYNVFTCLPAYEDFHENTNYMNQYCHSIMICATNIMEPYKKRYDVLIKKTNKLLIFHNAYKSYLFRHKGYESIFLPMFLYQYNLPSIQHNSFKYKYGITLDSSDCMLTYISYLQKIFSNNIMLLSRDKHLRNIFEHSTTDKQQFFNECESIIILTDKYASKHVGSRFVFECMHLQKPMYILCPSKEFIYDRTLQQFSSLQYELLDTFDMFTLWKVNNIDPKLIMYETYNTYLQTMLQCIEDKKVRTNIKQYQYAEEYIY